MQSKCNKNSTQGKNITDCTVHHKICNSNADSELVTDGLVSPTAWALYGGFVVFQLTLQQCNYPQDFFSISFYYSLQLSQHHNFLVHNALTLELEVFLQMHRMVFIGPGMELPMISLGESANNSMHLLSPTPCTILSVGYRGLLLFSSNLLDFVRQQNLNHMECIVLNANFQSLKNNALYWFICISNK